MNPESALVCYVCGTALDPQIPPVRTDLGYKSWLPLMAWPAFAVVAITWGLHMMGDPPPKPQSDQEVCQIAFQNRVNPRWGVLNLADPIPKNKISKDLYAMTGTLESLDYGTIKFRSVVRYVHNPDPGKTICEIKEFKTDPAKPVQRPWPFKQSAQ